MSGRRRVLVVTGSRAEFGLLRPVARAVMRRDDLELALVVAGSHLIPPAETYIEIRREFAVADAVPMQRADHADRADDAEALGRGIEKFARSFRRLSPDWVVVLGDRIEAFAAASAAAVGGWALAHIHGGDRAEGIADESMRHAITKLAHLHLAATETSAARIIRMGERSDAVHVVGSPAIDGLAEIEPMSDADAAELGDPRAVLLLHPSGLPDAGEQAVIDAAIAAAESLGGPVLVLRPNFDAGRERVLRAVEAAALRHGWRVASHLRRERFVALLKRLAGRGGALIGNSSAGLIEAAAIRLHVLDIGPRQAGRESTPQALRVGADSLAEIVPRFRRHVRSPLPGVGSQPFGDGRSGERIAALLVGRDPREPGLLRKCCTY